MEAQQISAYNQYAGSREKQLTRHRERSVDKDDEQDALALITKFAQQRRKRFKKDFILL